MEKQNLSYQDLVVLEELAFQGFTEAQVMALARCLQFLASRRKSDIRDWAPSVLTEYSLRKKDFDGVLLAYLCVVYG